MNNRTKTELYALKDFYSLMNDSELFVLYDVFAEKALDEDVSFTDRQEFAFRYEILSYVLANRYIQEHK